MVPKTRLLVLVQLLFRLRWMEAQTMTSKCGTAVRRLQTTMM
jgi:hypothetical protein